MRQPKIPSSSYRAADLGPRPPPRGWRLVLGSELMAELVFAAYETPWITVSVKPQPGLAPFMRYFADPDGWADDDATIDAMLEEIARRGGFRLFDDLELEAKPFTLVNLDGISANLRY